MNAIDKQALREAAGKVNSGDWSYEEFNRLDLPGGSFVKIDGRDAVYCLNKPVGGIKQSRAVIAFIATFNPKVALALLDELEAAEKRIAELEAREVTLPPLNDDLIAILGRPNFTCSHLAELMRKSGDEIRRKSEHEQAAVIHWFLGIYLEHGDKWEGVAKADIQSRVAAAGIGVKGE